MKRMLHGVVVVFTGLIVACSDGGKDDVEYDEHHPMTELRSFEVAEGFEVTLFASEPMVAKPIQMNWDAEGRLWVISSTAYPHNKVGEEANDKVFILEDTDGDGVADKSTVFAEGLNQPTGILPGDGGVYVANATEILYLADTDGDGKADLRRRVLSGFGTADTHHLIHTFRWGPEGRLYFNQSIYIHSHVETPWGIKRLEGGGVWKLQPHTLELDVYAKGLVNPWGLRFDAYGQSFLTDGAGEEGINYAFPGATFLASPGSERILRGLNPGQPKHSGLEYVSGRHLPESWEGSFITNDFRANRINRFQLEEQGSGYVSQQMPDVLWTDHVAFRPVDISIGPDGAIYVADWYNPIIQHGEVDFHDPRRDQERGRIWRITAKGRRLVKKPKLVGASVEELLDILKQPEVWSREQARQQLKERGAEKVAEPLQRWIDRLDDQREDDERLALEALWVSQAIDVFNGPLLDRLLQAKTPNVRAAAVRALQLWHGHVADLPTILDQAVKDPHPQVRLEGVIALRELGDAGAARTALAVLDQPMDEFLDFALWQTMRQLEPQWMDELDTNPAYFGNAAKTTYALKSAASPEAIDLLTEVYLAGDVPPQYKKDALSAIASRGGLSNLNAIFDWAIHQFSAEGADVSDELSAIENAASKRQVAVNRQPGRIGAIITGESEASAIAAIRLAGTLKVASLSGTLQPLTSHANREYAKAAMRALASINPRTAATLISRLTESRHPLDLRLLAVSQLAHLNASSAAKIAVDLLANLDDPEQAKELFDAFISDGARTQALGEVLVQTTIPEPVALAARQYLLTAIPGGRREAEDVLLLVKGLEASGGVLPAEGMSLDLDEEQIEALAAQAKRNGSPVRGELIYRKSELACLSCHAIGGAGGLIGPDLSSLGTSSPAETIIKSVIYPTESIKEGYELQRVARKNDSDILGYLVADRPNEVVIRDFTGNEVAIAKDNIVVREKVPGSLMPPNLTASLTEEEFVDLISYLSKLGTSGDFRVPPERYVRRWEAISANDDVVELITENGIQAVSSNDRLRVTPRYSMVSGALPIDELPVVETGQGSRYSFVKFQMEVLTPGEVSFSADDWQGVTSWADTKDLVIQGKELTASFAPGTHEVTLAIDRNVRNEGLLLVRLLDGNAQTRLVIGK